MITDNRPNHTIKVIGVHTATFYSIFSGFLTLCMKWLSYKILVRLNLSEVFTLRVFFRMFNVKKSGNRYQGP